MHFDKSTIFSQGESCTSCSSLEGGPVTVSVPGPRGEKGEPGLPGFGLPGKQVSGSLIVSHLGRGERGAVLLIGLVGTWSLDVEGNRRFLTE